MAALRSSFCSNRLRWLGLAFSLGLALALWAAPPAVGQDTPLPAQPTAAVETGNDMAEQFFADVLVRGKPVFQVGSLDRLSALDRARQINRRIAGLLNQDQPLDPVTVHLDNRQNLATLRLNNRVIMTVTSQDALDFDTTIPTLAEAWANRLNEAMAETNLVVDVMQRLQGTSQLFVAGIVENLPLVLGALLVMLFTWLGALLVRRAAIIWAERTEGDRNTEILIGRLCYGAVWMIGAIIALGVIGLNFTALLGTLGLTSVAIGFSLKDVLSNYMSGVILLAARPFRIGDQVVIKNYEGTITQIQLRATTMQTYDGRLVYIPNQEVFQASITNNTASPVRRSSVMVGIDYDADVARAIQVITDHVSLVEGVEADPAPVVLVRELGASTVNLETRFWVNSRRQSFLQVTSRVLDTIKRSLQEAQIDMPTDIYTVILKAPLRVDGKGTPLPETVSPPNAGPQP
jgi:small conductance mechanosensitive channel